MPLGGKQTYDQTFHYRNFFRNIYVMVRHASVFKFCPFIFFLCGILSIHTYRWLVGHSLSSFRTRNTVRAPVFPVIRVDCIVKGKKVSKNPREPSVYWWLFEFKIIIFMHIRIMQKDKLSVVFSVVVLCVI